MIGTIEVSNRKIGEGCPPFIVAEMSGNHDQSLEKALRLIDKAAATGVDAIKIQTYTPDTMTFDSTQPEFCVSDPNGLWRGETLYSLYKKAYLPWEWHERIMQRCKEKKLICFSTPFDETAVDFLESLHVPLYKIASFENTYAQLLKKVAGTGKPVIISSGMASADELERAVTILKANGCKDVVILKCTSAYPSDPLYSNLRTIVDIRDKFNVNVGISDHTMGIGAAIASVALGAVVIEKHITLSRSEKGVDSAFSLEPDEMSVLVKEAHAAWKALGKIAYGPVGPEKELVKYRRSIYVVNEIKKGEFIQAKHLKIIRPGYGLPSDDMDAIIGKKAKRDLSPGMAMKKEYFE